MSPDTETGNTIMTNKTALRAIAQAHSNPLIRQRAWRGLRLRYGVQKPLAGRPDPVWLAAVGM